MRISKILLIILLIFSFSLCSVSAESAVSTTSFLGVDVFYRGVTFDDLSATFSFPIGSWDVASMFRIDHPIHRGDVIHVSFDSVPSAGRVVCALMSSPFNASRTDHDFVYSDLSFDYTLTIDGDFYLAFYVRSSNQVVDFSSLHITVNGESIISSGSPVTILDAFLTDGQTVEIKPGWAALFYETSDVLDITSHVANLTFNSTLPFKINNLGSWHSGAKFFGSDELVSGSSSLINSGQEVTWSPVGDTGILGSTYSARFVHDFSFPYDSSYYYFVNPSAYSQQYGSSQWVNNNSVFVTVNSANNVSGTNLTDFRMKLIPISQLSQSLSFDSDDPNSAFVRGDGLIVTEEGGEDPYPSYNNGGYNNPTYDSNTDSGFVSAISNIFGTASDLAQGLYSSISSFFQTIFSLWSYLPQELLAFLISVVSVVCVVCIIKLFR